MDNILHRFASALARYPDDGNSPALLLCDDRQSVLTALAASRIGRSFQPYAFVLAGYPHLASKAADRLGWKLKLIHPSIDELGADFIRLVLQYRCLDKAQFELGYILMHACEIIPEKTIWVSAVRPADRAWLAVERIANRYAKTLVNPTFGQQDDLNLRRNQILNLIEEVAAHRSASKAG